MSAGRIGVGLVGLGNSGWYYHAEGTLMNSDDFELVAVSGRTAERTAAAAERFEATPHPTWQSLITDDRVEVVVVATPHDLHAPIAIGALEAGRHVVVEKPMAITTAEAESMIDTAKRAERMLTVFHNRRWEPSFRLIRDLVANGAVGEVWRVEERRMHRGRYVTAGTDRPHAGAEPAAWAHRRDGGGGVGYLIAPHLIDHQLLLNPEPVISVAAITDTFAGDEVEHYLDLRLDFAGGHSSRIEIFREQVVELPKWTVFGTAGTIVCPDFNRLSLQTPAGTRDYTGLAPLQACNEFYDALARALRAGGPPPVDPSEAARVVTVLEAARRSAAQRGSLVPMTPTSGCSERGRS
jgi:predicted dehydrogenase